jgi:DNA-binding transcriptional regulator YhcF (GntR family)
MKELLFQIDASITSSKVTQLTDAIINAISNNVFREGDILPSVNAISKEYGISRDTVFKAYSELKRLGVVESTRAKSYHVVNSSSRVFLFLDLYSPFKDALYNAFRDKLDDKYIVDLGFHYYNRDIFETVISHSLGKYNMYVVMNYNNDKMHEVLNKIDKNKLLLLDWGNFKGENLSYVNQDFGKGPYECLIEAEKLLSKYDEFIYVDSKLSQHPKETSKWFAKFCRERKIKHKIVTKIDYPDIVSGKAFFLVQHLDVVSLLKYSKVQKLKVGKDIGIICYNDSPMFEVMDNGITVISTDFAKMGELAAEFINTKTKIQETVPTSLIVRGSL